jgi:hypothetical protein
MFSSRIPFKIEETKTDRARTRREERERLREENTFAYIRKTEGGNQRGRERWRGERERVRVLGGIHIH